MRLKIFLMVVLVLTATAGCAGGIRMNEREEAGNPAGGTGIDTEAAGEGGAPNDTIQETGTIILKGRVLEPSNR